MSTPHCGATSEPLSRLPATPRMLCLTRCIDGARPQAIGKELVLLHHRTRLRVACTAGEQGPPPRGVSTAWQPDPAAWESAPGLSRGRAAGGTTQARAAQALACQRHHVELRRKARKLALPIGQRGDGHNDQMGPRAALVAQGGQESDGLDGLSQAHLAGGEGGRGEEGVGAGVREGSTEAGKVSPSALRQVCAPWWPSEPGSRLQLPGWRKHGAGAQAEGPRPATACSAHAARACCGARCRRNSTRAATSAAGRLACSGPHLVCEDQVGAALPALVQPVQALQLNGSGTEGAVTEGAQEGQAWLGEWRGVRSHAACAPPGHPSQSSKPRPAARRRPPARAAASQSRRPGPTGCRRCCASPGKGAARHSKRRGWRQSAASPARPGRQPSAWQRPVPAGRGGRPALTPPLPASLVEAAAAGVGAR